MTPPADMRGGPGILGSSPFADADGAYGWRHLLRSGPVLGVALFGLCAAYLQGGLYKVLDWLGAVAKPAHFGMPVPAFADAAAIVTELVGSALVLSGRLRWLGALSLAAFTLAATFVANCF